MLYQLQQYTLWAPCIFGLVLFFTGALDRRHPATKPAMLALGFALACWGAHFAMPIHGMTDATGYAVAGISGLRETWQAVRVLRDAQGEQNG